MLIQALCEYYRQLARCGQVLPDGYSRVALRYLVSLTLDGQIDAIIDWQLRSSREDAKGKVKEIILPREVIMPKRTEKPGIEANIVEHRPLYLFGLNLEQGQLNPQDKTAKAEKSHRDFISRNLDFLEGLDSPVVNAFRNFIHDWNPEEQVENLFLLSLGKNYSTASFAFCLSGRPDLLLHEDPLLNAKWQAGVVAARQYSQGATLGQCSVSGQEAPLARIHQKIKGVSGGLTTGNTLISFKNPSESSYGHDQSYNSNLSQRAMEEYTESLNYLLAHKQHRAGLDDLTVLYWSTDSSEKCENVFRALALSPGMDAAETDEMLRRLLTDAQQGQLTLQRLQAVCGVDPNVDFYILGLKPNAARLSVKFLYRRSFGNVLRSIAQHQADIRSGPESRPVALWQIKKELVSPKSNDKNVDPALMAKLMEAMVCGYNYPHFLLSTMVRRVRIDSDEENNSYIKLNPIRAGLIRGCINRQARLAGKKEELTLALDTSNTTPAYLCGRLFAVLEAVQLKAANYNLNRTIKDSYFSAASSRPASVFPQLLRTATYHLSKLDNPKYANDDIGGVVDLLGNEFPVQLSLADQGKFIIGYYHQKADAERKIALYKQSKEGK